MMNEWKAWGRVEEHGQIWKATIGRGESGALIAVVYGPTREETERLRDVILRAVNNTSEPPRVV